MLHAPAVGEGVDEAQPVAATGVAGLAHHRERAGTARIAHRDAQPPVRLAQVQLDRPVAAVLDGVGDELGDEQPVYPANPEV